MKDIGQRMTEDTGQGHLHTEMTNTNLIKADEGVLHTALTVEVMMDIKKGKRRSFKIWLYQRKKESMSTTCVSHNNILGKHGKIL